MIFITQKSKPFCDKPNSPLAHLGVPIIVIHDHDLMSIARVIERVGKITGTYAAAKKAAQSFFHFSTGVETLFILDSRAESEMN